MADKEIKYEIIRCVGVVSRSAANWTKELNLISWNGKPEKYDIREWSPDREKMSKGITFTESEAETIKELLINELE